jgi:hypothetical protein
MLLFKMVYLAHNTKLGETVENLGWQDNAERLVEPVDLVLISLFLGIPILVLNKLHGEIACNRTWQDDAMLVAEDVEPVQQERLKNLINQPILQVMRRLELSLVLLLVVSCLLLRLLDWLSIFGIEVLLNESNAPLTFEHLNGFNQIVRICQQISSLHYYRD